MAIKTIIELQTTPSDRDKPIKVMEDVLASMKNARVSKYDEIRSY